MSADKVTDAPVNDVTATLANTTIKDDKAEAFLASAAEGRRLYIGNLAYATTEGELKEFFKSYLVESVSIPKNPRTDRPVGYAFVDLSTPSEADRAVTELSGQEILERKVSVQLARKPEAAAEKEAAPVESTEGNRRRQSTRGGARGNRARGGRRGGRAADAEGAPADENAPPTESTAPEVKDPNAPAAEETGKKASQPRTRAPVKERGPPADGVPSKTKVMVANLPYDLKEDALKELFSAYEPSSAKIALRPIPRFMIKKLQARNEPRKGRGFGFVTLASEELQQKAVAEMNGKDIGGREIAVKVAIDSPDKTDEEANTPADEPAAEAEAKPAPAPVAEVPAVTA